MKSPSNYELNTGAEPVESWLARYDGKPRVLPRWPGRRMALVACVVEDFDTHAEAHARGFVLVQPAQADALCNFSHGLDSVGVLFFRVPRLTLVDAGVVPGLAPDSWE